MNRALIATNTATVITIYHAGRRLWQVRQRVLVQLAGRSQLRQVIRYFLAW